MAKRRGKVVSPVRRYLYPRTQHPDNIYRNLVDQYGKHASRMIDIGCGHEAPVLDAVKSDSCLKVGIDLDPVLRSDKAPAVKFVRADCSKIPFGDNTFNLAISRSVLEHLTDPESVFSEVQRILAPKGLFLFLTPNRWDYVSIASTLIPNNLHPSIVRRLTGRHEEDTFPTQYRANSALKLKSIAKANGFEVLRLELLRAHPHYLQFSSITYLSGVVFEQIIQRHFKTVRPWLLGLFRKLN